MVLRSLQNIFRLIEYDRKVRIITVHEIISQYYRVEQLISYDIIIIIIIIINERIARCCTLKYCICIKQDLRVTKTSKRRH